MPEIITVMKTVPSPIVAGRGVNKATTFTVVSPTLVPAIPPRLERINDSIRNCVDISSLLAPNAFLSLFLQFFR